MELFNKKSFEFDVFAECALNYYLCLLNLGENLELKN